MQAAAIEGHTEVTAWLELSRDWATPLHHLSIIDAARARTLLRNGASVHAAATADGPTPLSMAEAMRVAGDAPDGSAAALVLAAAAQRWSPATHLLFPAAARALAVRMLLLGHQLSRQQHNVSASLISYHTRMYTSPFPSKLRETLTCSFLPTTRHEPPQKRGQRNHMPPHTGRVRLCRVPVGAVAGRDGALHQLGQCVSPLHTVHTATLVASLDS